MENEEQNYEVMEETQKEEPKNQDDNKEGTKNAKGFGFDQAMKDLENIFM